MHYSNGTPAKEGDIIIGNDSDGIPFVGLVLRTVAQNTTCNLVVAPISDARRWLTASDCVLAKEAIAALQKPAA